jgi:hypothetical protein
MWLGWYPQSQEGSSNKLIDPSPVLPYRGHAIECLYAERSEASISIKRLFADARQWVQTVQNDELLKWQTPQKIIVFRGVCQS